MASIKNTNSSAWKDSLSKKHFKNTIIKNLDIKNVDLTDVVFENVVFKNVNFLTNSSKTKVIFSKCNFKSISFDNSIKIESIDSSYHSVRLISSKEFSHPMSFGYSSPPPLASTFKKWPYLKGYTRSIMEKDYVPLDSKEFEKMNLTQSFHVTSVKYTPILKHKN